MPSPTASDRLASVLRDAPPDARVYLYIETPGDAGPLASFSCSQCTGTGTGGSPGSIQHDSCCIYVGGSGC